MRVTVSTYLLPPPDGVRVSGGHLCEAEAPTEAAAETVSKQSFDGGGENTVCKKNSPSVIKTTAHHIYSLQSNIRHIASAQNLTE